MLVLYGVLFLVFRENKHKNPVPVLQRFIDWLPQNIFAVIVAGVWSTLSVWQYEQGMSVLQILRQWLPGVYGAGIGFALNQTVRRLWALRRKA